MAVKEFPAGTHLIQSEQNLTALHVIAKGSVCASYPGGTFYLKKGDVIGVCLILSRTLQGSTTFPLCFDIFMPFLSLTCPKTIQFLNGALPNRMVFITRRV